MTKNSKADNPDAVNLGTRKAGHYRLLPPTNMSRGPSGIYLGSGVGNSIDFHDFREYQPGDDLRRIDWSAYARSDVLSLRLYQEEISPVVEIIIDNSKSIAAYNGKKFAALFLASFLTSTCRQTEGRPVLLDGISRHTGMEIEHTLRGLKFNSCVMFTQNFPPSQFGKPIRIFISDFLFSHNLEVLFRNMNRDASTIIPIMILSETEINPTFSGACRLNDCENNNQKIELEITAYAVEQYKTRLSTHIENLEHYARRYGGQLIKLNIPDVVNDSESFIDGIVNQLTELRVVEAGR